MNTHTLIAIALAALLVFAGAAAAAPGGSSGTPGADAADEHGPDDPGADASDQANETDGNETDADEASADAGDVSDANDDAPPTEMPEQAPQHVTQIHDLIREKLDGALTGQELGEALSGLGGNADEAEANGQADEAGDHSEAGDDARANADDAGPPSDLPEQVPDHVSRLHDLIVSFLNGDGEGNLGTQISAAASG